MDEGLSWRTGSTAHESETGQLLLYIMGAHLERVRLTRADKWKTPAPILGLFMKNMTVCYLLYFS